MAKGLECASRHLRILFSHSEESQGIAMIEQVLNREVLQSVLQQMKSVASTPVENDRREGDASVPPNVREPEALLADIAAATRYANPSTEERRSDEPSPASKADSTVYIPASPELSNLQTAIEKYFTEKRPWIVEKASTDPGETERRDAPAGMAAITGERLTNVDTSSLGRRLLGPFEQTDIRWINSWFAEGMRKFRGKHSFVPRPTRDKPILFADKNARMVIFGDWGSGIPRAGKVAKIIRRELDAGKAAGLQQFVIHLGDVYYSGWEHEYRDRLLRDWPVHIDEKETIGSFNLNGNHDMFSGGHAFYEYALADARFAPWQGKSSLFHLANSHWQLFGLDTAWEDAALKDDQAQWMLAAADRKRKTILLSHHQYCSTYEKVSEKVTTPIQPVLKALDVAAWLWGHEHRCMKYEPFGNVRFPRCLGHAGVPVYQNHGLADPLPPGPGTWEYRDHYDSFEGWWAKFGFVTLDFQDGSIQARYFDEDGLENKAQSEMIS
jgi:hypothetical protein